MSERKICSTCLITDVRLIKIDLNLKKLYLEVTGLKDSDFETLPCLVCYLCYVNLKRCYEFKRCCLISQNILKCLLSSNGELTKAAVKKIDRKALGLISPLSFLDVKKAKFVSINSHWGRDLDLNPIRKENGPDDHDDCIIIEPPSAKDTTTPEIKLVINDKNIQNHVETENTEYPKTGSTLNVDSEIEDDLNDISDSEINEYIWSTPTKKSNVHVKKTVRQMRKPTTLKRDRNAQSLEVPHPFSDKHEPNILLTPLEHLNDNEKDPLLTKVINNEGVEGSITVELPGENKMDDKELSMLNRLITNEENQFHHKVKLIEMESIKPKENIAEFTKKPLPKRKINIHRDKNITMKNNKEKQYIVVCRKNFVMKVMTPEEISIRTSMKKQDKSKKYKCEHCFTGFNVEKAFKSHVHRHEYGVFGELQCDICKKYMSHKPNIRTHIRQCHTYKYTCRACGYFTYTSTQAQRHYERKHYEKVRKCNYCSMESTSEYALSKHVSTTHSSIPCEICGQCSVTIKGITFHKKHKHGVKHTPQTDVNKDDELYCADCETLFLNKQAFDQHKLYSSKHNTDDGQISMESLRNKRRPQKSKTCRVCNEILPNYHQYRQHYKLKHPGLKCPNPFLCENCGKSFVNLVLLSHHKNTHTKAKPYICAVCSKAYQNPGNLQRHVKSIHGEKRFICDLCDNKCATKYDLRIHIQTIHLKMPHITRIKAENRRQEKRRMQRMMMRDEIN